MDRSSIANTAIIVDVCTVDGMDDKKVTTAKPEASMVRAKDTVEDTVDAKSISLLCVREEIMLEAMVDTVDSMVEVKEMLTNTKLRPKQPSMTVKWSRPLWPKIWIMKFVDGQ